MKEELIFKNERLQILQRRLDIKEAEIQDLKKKIQEERNLYCQLMRELYKYCQTVSPGARLSDMDNTVVKIQHMIIEKTIEIAILNSVDHV